MGRKRIHPLGTDATDRAVLSLKQLVENGGARRTFRLSKEGNAALKTIARELNLDNDTAAAEYAFLLVAASLRAKALVPISRENHHKKNARAA